MPRNYKRKTNRQNWNEAGMLSALDAVRDGTPYKTASRQFSVPVMTLKRRAKGVNKHTVDAVKMLGSKKTVFSPEQERELIHHIKDMESRMYGLTKSDIVSLAFQLAEKNNIDHPFSRDKGKAGAEWLKGFRKRNPESTSAARARAFNKPVVDKFFSILKDIQEKHLFAPHRKYNVGETSLCTVPTKNTKVFAQTGRKQVARVTSAERGDTTTAVICCSASGVFIPPMFIFRRIRMNMELMDGAPPGSAYACNTTGWMKLEIFEQWFDHFLSYAKPTEDEPALLFLDGHLSHTKNLNVILKAHQNHVLILCLPPHCTHKLQPLDVGVMYPLSVYHNQSLEKWMNNNPGRVVTVFQITKIFAETYLKAATPLNAINGFSKCGIYPLNQDVFTDVDYVAAETTEKEMDPQDESSSESLSILSNSTPAQSLQTRNVLEEFLNMRPGPSTEGLIAMETNDISFLLQNEHATHSPEIVHLKVAGSSHEFFLELEKESSKSHPIITSNLSPKTMQVPSTSSKVQVVTSILPEKERVTSTPQTVDVNTVSPCLSQVDEVDLPSTSFVVFAPHDILPLPKIQGKRSNLKRKKVDTSILTSTPYKNYLEEELKKTILNEEKQKARKDNKTKKSVLEKKFKGKGIGKNVRQKKNDSQRDGNEKQKQVSDQSESSGSDGGNTGQKGKKKQGIGKTSKQRIEKGKQKKKRDESSTEDDDTECMFCTEPYSKDKMGEGWALCVSCRKWGHEACAGIDGDDSDDFICDICKYDYRDVAKKLLKF